MIMPNFLIIGAAKAGTTSLEYYLDQHPQIHMSLVKEPKFFALEGQKLDFQNPDQGINHFSVTSLEKYRALFQDVSDEIAIGEASPLYLYSPEAPNRIKHYIPHAKLIAILRNPTERAYSSYMHLVREGYETLSFEEGLREEKRRIQAKWAHLWHYERGGYYYSQLQRYFDTFDRNQIRVYLYENLNDDSIAVVQDIFRFLGVDDSFAPDLTRMNVSGIPKSRLLYNFFARKNLVRTILTTLLPMQFRKSISQHIKKWNLTANPSISVETKKKLIEVYREDVLRLQELIQRDLSKWLV